jgi:penicillin-binding protein 1A
MTDDRDITGTGTDGPIPFPGGDGEGPRVRPRVKKLRLALILAGLAALAVVSTVFGMMMALASDLPKLENKPTERNTVLYDVQGQRIGILTGQQARILLRPEQISPAMKHAMVAIEDRRFYEHSGVDIRGVGRALVQDVVNRGAVQGGSTIPQQFVKNYLKAQSQRTLFQKLREAALAYHLTRKWSKEKILDEYLNSIYFGNGAYGVESAARTYFGWAHPGCGQSQDNPCAALLQPHEAALIAGVVSSPSGYDPVAHPDAALARRNLVLKRLLEQGYITRAQYDAGIAEALPAKGEIQPPQEKAVTSGSTYFTSWIRQQVVDHVGERAAFSGGLKVYTSLDLALQRAAETAVQSRLGATMLDSALVAIDNRTGEVRAMIGGRNYNKTPFNLATQGQRQPGSAFKPFVLATALKGGVSPTSLWVSKKLELKVPGSKGERFVVNNYEDAYQGVTTLAKATALSDNAVFAQVGKRYGTRNVARMARRLGIRTPVSHNLAISLGGLKEGVTPIDMAHAYSTLAEGGTLVSGSLAASARGPSGLHRIVAGKRTIENTRRVKRVLSKEVAGTTTALLEGAVKFGTGKAAALGAETVAGKTGTTENYGDAWFVGYTKRLTVAVWVGYADRLRSMETEFAGRPVAGGTYPALIYHDFMTAVLKVYLDRTNAQRVKDGKEPLTPTGPQTTPVVPGTSAPATTPVAPQTTTTPKDGGATGGTDGGTKTTPAPQPEPDPQPTPTPTTPADNGTGTGTDTGGGGAGAAAPPPN